MKYISRDKAIARVKERMEYHRRESQLLYPHCLARGVRGKTEIRKAREGHYRRKQALLITLIKLRQGCMCNRAVAQLFGKGYRIKDRPTIQRYKTTEEL